MKKGTSTAMQTRLSTTAEALDSANPQRGDTSPLRQYSWLLLIGAGPAFLLAMRLFPSLERTIYHNALGHTLIVGTATLLGVMLALLVLHVAYRARDGRVFLVGMGFLSAASIFAIHAIATPGVLMDGRELATSWSALLSLVLSGIFFALSGLDLSAAFNSWLMRRARLWLALYTLFWLVYAGALLVVVPAAMSAASQQPAQPAAPRAREAGPSSYGSYDYGYGSNKEHEHTEPPATSAPTAPAQPALPLDSIRLGLVLVGLGAYAFAAARHYRLYRRAPSQTGFVILCGVVLFGEALLTQQISQVYSSSFWLYHAEEFAAFGAISYAVLGAYRRGQSGEGLLESLFLAGTHARLQAHYAGALDTLVENLSRGEQPTPALRATLRERFGLTESQVQVLERAAEAVAHERQQRQELEQLNAALRQLEQDKQQLMQMVVHDLKNPLTALVGFLDILRMGALSEDQRYLVEGALRSGKNLSGLIGDLLDVARLEEGRLELQISPFAPRDLLMACAEEMRGWLAQEEKTIAIEAPDDLPLLNADLRLTRRVLLNLISNAIKHTTSGTHITLRARPLAPSVDAGASADQIVIDVADDGPGIAPEYLSRIFEKFEQGNGAPHARQDSTGLGLTFCRLATEAQGGTIEVTSSLGHGTTFAVTLPASAF